MTNYTIALPQTGNKGFKLKTSLSGIVYNFTFQYCSRDDSWFFHLSDAARSPIFTGVRVEADFPVLAALTDTRKPPGNLLFVDTSKQGLAPKAGELGSRVIMAYDDLIDA